uniref:Protein FAM21A n=1 Tax=Magallana gigas TaxID=29159 RepID=K1QYB9_MAGGI
MHLQYSDSEGSDLFGEEDEEKSKSELSESEEEEEEEEEPTAKKPSSAPLDFASELAKKLKGPGAAPAEENDEEEPVKETKETKSKEEEPFPADEEEDSPFGNKGGLFSGSKGLFDDSEEDEGDLFSESVPKKKSSKKKVESEEEEENEDADNDMFSEKKAEKKKPSSSAPSSSGGGGGLFDNEEEEDDLFSSAAPKTTTEKPKKKGAVPMFGGGANPLAAAIKKQRKQESDEEDNWSDEEKPRASSVKSTQSVTSINSLSKSAGVSKVTNKASPSPSSNSLFDDDADDALFAAPAKPRADSGKKKPTGGVSLFGDDVLPKKDKPAEKKPEPTKTSKPAKAALSLFDDEEEEEEGDIFGAPATKKAPTKSAATNKAKGLFDDGDGMFGEEDSPGVDIFNKPKASPKQNDAPVSKTKSPSALFDGEEDDLFSSSKPTESLPVGGVTTEESTDVPEKVEEPKPKKPIGGVSMFGGMDPMAALRNKGKKENEVKDKDVTPPPTKAKDSDEEDITDKPEPPPMEAPKTEKKTKPGKIQEVVEEKEEIKPKKPIGGVSMFGGMDPMAALRNKGKKENEVKDKEVTPPSTKAKDSDDEERPEPPPLDSPKPSVKAKAADPLFGDDEEDDMFSVAPITNLSTTRPSKPSKPSITSKPILPSKSRHSKSETSQKPNLFGSPKSDEDEDLFSSTSKPSKKEPQSSPSGSSPRKPVGGVSMFGGVDPFGLGKKSEPMPDSPLSEGDGEANLAINPAAMLPGAAPPVREPQVVPVGFDIPAQANTLHSANKSRAKIQTKRRPPSRKGRQGGGPSVSTEEDSISTPSEAPPPKVESPPKESRVPKPTSDLFGNDDLLGETHTVNDFLAPPPVPDNYVEEEENEDFFSSSKKKEKVMSDDDLFSPVTAPKGAASNSSKPTSVLNSKTDEEDDLFGSSSTKNTSKFVSKKKADSNNVSAIVNGGEDVLSEKSKSAASVENEDEDLFAEKPKIKKQSDFEKILDEKSETSKTESKVPALDDDDDLFANSSVNKKPGK